VGITLQGEWRGECGCVVGEYEYSGCGGGRSLEEGLTFVDRCELEGSGLDDCELGGLYFGNELLVEFCACNGSDGVVELLAVICVEGIISTDRVGFLVAL
jgi:hypothetical protein